MKKIIIDLLGADNGAEPILDGALEAAIAHKDVQFVLVGQESAIKKEIEKRELANVSSASGLSKRIEIINAEDFIKNEEPAMSIFNARDDSSIALGLKQLKEDKDTVGMLSAGNTGALLIGSTFRLGLVKGLKTPALASCLRSKTGRMFCLVDCGANVNCTAKDLANFAMLGNSFAKCMFHLDEPAVALLSVGREKGKGNSLTVEAYDLIEKLPLHFIGNAEGYDLINGYADVIVADGYAGNLMLKSIESSGQAAMRVVSNQLEDALDDINDDDSLDAATKKENSEALRHMVNKMLSKLSSMFDLNSKGGATFLGTQKPVIKMHGCAVSETVTSCVDQLLTLCKEGYEPQIICESNTEKAQQE